MTTILGQHHPTQPARRPRGDRLWHPYDSLPPSFPPLVVEAAEGVRLRLSDGRELVDGMSSWWSVIHGYRHPVLDAAVKAQLDRMAHVMFGGLTHAPAEELGERLIELTPPGLEHVFLADSGSVAVEVAIKMCMQAQHGLGRPERRRLMTVRGGYHGDTFGAMSVCDPVDGMHGMFRSLLPEQVFAPSPPPGFSEPLERAWAHEVGRLVRLHAHELAAMIVEPIVQGAGGMRFHSPACLRLLRQLCDDHDVLLVFDEVATGFGRTGALFAAEHAGVAPDVMTVGKALTGGYCSLAATLCTGDVAEAIGRSPARRLMHGPTYMANPLACAVAGASLGLLAEGGWRGQVARIARGLRFGLAPARTLPGVAGVRVLGAIGVVQLEHAVDVAAATAAAAEEGVWLRPFRDLVYTMPPYVTDDDDLARIARGVLAAAAAGGVT